MVEIAHDLNFFEDVRSLVKCHESAMFTDQVISNKRGTKKNKTKLHSNESQLPQSKWNAFFKRDLRTSAARGTFFTLGCRWLDYIEKKKIGDDFHDCSPDGVA